MLLLVALFIEKVHGVDLTKQKVGNWWTFCVLSFPIRKSLCTALYFHSCCSEFFPCFDRYPRWHGK